MRLVLAAMLLLLVPGCQPEAPFCADCARPWPPARPGYTNPIPAENALAGDPDWSAGTDPVAPQVLQVYLDHVSVPAGGTVAVMASAESSHDVEWALYRFGWYGGAGARQVASGDPVTVWQQPDCPMNPSTGLVRCAWTPILSIQVPAEAPSGLYAVKLTRDDGVVRFAPLVVVDDRPADLLLQASVNTYQAYNDYGGASLYKDATHSLPRPMAVEVGFDRPYTANRGLAAALTNEIPFARMLERYGYDVSYTTNIDVAVSGWPHLFRAGAFLSVGHDEYWAGEEREAAQEARDRGVPLLFFGGNAAYWKVRHEQPDDTGVPRVITCYKSRRQDDPVTGPDATGRYRDLGMPENSILGGFYGGWMVLNFGWVASDAASWLVEGTGLQTGDALPLIVGNEYDRREPNRGEPDGLEVLAQSPVINADGRPDWAMSVSYRASSGALVFDAGTIDWAHALDPEGGIYDSRVERMTANVLLRALGLRLPRMISVPMEQLTRSARGPYASAVETRSAGLSAPFGVAAHPLGTVIVDSARNGVYQLARGDTPVLIAGGGVAPPSADPVPGLAARFNTPTAALALPDGSILVADTGQHCIRRIANDAARTVTVFAGQLGAAGDTDAPSGPPTAARFAFPMGLALDPRTGAVIVADSRNHRVRAIGPDGHVSTLAGGGLGDVDGPGATARFSFPTAVAAAQDGRVFVVSSLFGKVKVIGPDPAHTVVTLAAGGLGYVDGDGTVARFAPFGGVSWTGSELVIADSANFVLRALTPGSDAASTRVRTLAGAGGFGFVDGTGAEARFGLPLGVLAGPDGLLVADAGFGAVRFVRP